LQTYFRPDPHFYSWRRGAFQEPSGALQPLYLIRAEALGLGDQLLPAAGDGIVEAGEQGGLHAAVWAVKGRCGIDKDGNYKPA